jgi:iron(III) transport system ATP-binding protein
MMTDLRVNAPVTTSRRRVGLSVSGLSKAYTPGVLAADDVSFALEPGKLFTLLGPSGSGKTTTLRSVAGLENPDQGEISCGDRRVFSSSDKIDTPANRRGFGMVFQSYAIWPHMTVFDNVAYPLTVRRRRDRPSKPEIRKSVRAALARVQLDNLESRRATKLSGGQQQRLALARALVMEPPLLLLDEPLSNLDAKLREDMRLELQSLQRDLGVTTLYVTHDQTEALALSDQIGVMNKGRLVQVGSPSEIYLEPASRFVAEFIGSTNLVNGEVVDATGKDCVVQTTAGRVYAQTPDQVSVGDPMVVSLRPELVMLSERSADRPPRAGSWEGVVRTRAYLGEAADHLVVLNDGAFELRVRTAPGASVPPSTAVDVSLDGAMARAFAVTDLVDKSGPRSRNQEASFSAPAGTK